MGLPLPNMAGFPTAGLIQPLAKSVLTAVAYLAAAIGILAAGIFFALIGLDSVRAYNRTVDQLQIAALRVVSIRPPKVKHDCVSVAMPLSADFSSYIATMRGLEQNGKFYRVEQDLGQGAAGCEQDERALILKEVQPRRK
jgi:hypothetical protein